MGQNITINPITRLEGHGKIEIFLDEKGFVQDAYWQVVEMRGFERFVVGRPVEEMPRIMPNICGVCPSPHNIAATKAVDNVFGVSPTPAAELIRRLHLNAFLAEDHYVHFYFLSSPDFILGPNADPAIRNILGVVDKMGIDVGRKVIEIRKKVRSIIRLIASKPPHPESGLPGGCSRGITEAERVKIKEIAYDNLEFAKFSIGLFKDLALKNKEFSELIANPAYSLNVNNLCMVNGQNQLDFYGDTQNTMRITGNSQNQEIDRFAAKDYVNHIGEWVEPWTYIRFTFAKKLGWTGLEEGNNTGMLRVGPLARFNAVDGMITTLAQIEHQEMLKTLGGKPVNQTLAYHWARLIEALQASESMVEIAENPMLTSKDIRNMNFNMQKEGIGAIEAARGTLLHHFKTDEKGFITAANLLVATQHNAGPICASITKAAKAFVKGPDIREGFLNQVEMAFRAYDPCLSCSTHAIGGGLNLSINIRNHKQEILRTFNLTQRKNTTL
ncbi:MAG: Ni/Fe hydrogenase subunit alpha [Chloroflexi bacterium]|nr:Ni/Fe hydrogenase subunit alpha [Chloroflexota bacterium]